jgi:signal transduction histidine kinase/CheY-like chemotaxis protein
MTTSTPPPPPLATHSFMLAEHLDLMFKQSKAVFGGNFIMAGLSVFVLWGFFDHRLVLIWGTAIFLLTLGRIVFVAQYMRRKPKPEHVARWAWAFAATSLISGTLWGSMGVLFFDPQQPLTVLFVCWALAGMATAAVPTLSNFLPAYIGFAVPALVPYVVHCFVVGGEVYTVLGVLTPYFLAANILYARTSNRSIGESIRLRFENVALLEQLSHEKERAESANNAKTKFLAAASHDLRQPTHAMGLFLSALDRMLRRDNGTPASSANLLSTVGRMQLTLKGMGNLLNSLLDTSRLESGAIRIERGPIRLRELFDSLQNEFGEAARRKGIELRCRPTSLAVESDPVLLRRILANLIANAIKYTVSGRVLVGCRRSGRRVEICVYDTGIGIPSTHHESIFEEFVQLDNSARNREQGLGLGLSIVRRAANLLGHSLRMRSEPDRGSMFALGATRAVNIASRETVAAPAADTKQSTGLIIVIDDDNSAREAIEDLLRAHGYDVIAAASIPQMRARLETTRPDAQMIVADYRLGDGVTGVEAIAAIQPLLAKTVPAIIVTGDTSPDRIREATASGYPLLHKPLDAAQLIDTIQATTKNFS